MKKIKKVLFIIILMMIIKTVNAANGIKNPFTDEGKYGWSEVESVQSFDFKGDYEAIVGNNKQKQFGLFVFKNRELKYSVLNSENIEIDGVVLIPNYVIGIDTESGYTGTFNDLVNHLYIYNLTGELIQTISFTEENNMRVFDVGNGMFATVYGPDMMYSKEAIEGQIKRYMYDVYKLKNDSFVKVADNEETAFDTRLFELDKEQSNNIQSIRYDNDKAVIVYDNRLGIGPEDEQVNKIALFDKNQKNIIFEGNIMDDVQDIAILDNFIVVLGNNYNSGTYLCIFTTNGIKIITSKINNNPDINYHLSGNKGIYVIKNETETRRYHHYHFDTRITGLGTTNFKINGSTLDNQNDINIINLVASEDVVEFSAKPSEYYNFKGATFNNEELKCTEQDETYTCSFTMPHNDTSLLIEFVGQQFQILEGANQSYAKGKDIRIRTEAPLKLLKSVTIKDKELVKGKDYTTEEGSTIIIISNDYLKTLKNGSYDVSINYTNGTNTTTRFDVTTNPNTADNIMPLVALTILSIFTYTAIHYFKIKRYN